MSSITTELIHVRALFFIISNIISLFFWIFIYLFTKRPIESHNANILLHPDIEISTEMEDFAFLCQVFVIIIHFSGLCLVLVNQFINLQNVYKSYNFFQIIECVVFFGGFEAILFTEFSNLHLDSSTFTIIHIIKQMCLIQILVLNYTDVYQLVKNVSYQIRPLIMHFSIQQKTPPPQYKLRQPKPDLFTDTWLDSDGD